MKVKYLITAIGGDIGNSVIHCLYNEFSKNILVGCDVTPFIPGYDEIGEFFLAPPYLEEEKYLEFILEKCKKYKITHILPMTEGEIQIFNKYREKTRLAGLKVMIQNSDLLDIAFSKYNTALAIKVMGLNSPKTWKPGEITEEIEYPVIVKPDRGCGSKYVKIITNLNEYHEAISIIPDAVIQEYIGKPEDEYTVGLFSNGKNVKVIAFKRMLDLNGMSKVVEVIEDKKINDIAETIAKYFNLKGSINFQMRKQRDQYYIFEINPRISSTVGFRYKLGFKDIIWWLELLDGNENEIYYKQEELPIMGVRSYEEKIFRSLSITSKTIRL